MPSDLSQNLLLSCEHGGNLIPAHLAPHFRGRKRLLHSHRGWDPGALELATQLATTLGAPLTAALVSRLVVDLNRSPNNPTLFSPFTSSLTAAEKAHILATYYTPYRNHLLGESLSAATARKPLLHLSIHTFTPILRGRRRHVDIGILFDPNRPREAAFAQHWKHALEARLPNLTIRFNQPYRGTDDGLATHIRSLIPDRYYAGIELEVNQRFPRRRGRAWQNIRLAVADSLAQLTRAVATGRPRR